MSLSTTNNGLNYSIGELPTKKDSTALVSDTFKSRRAGTETFEDRAEGARRGVKRVFWLAYPDAFFVCNFAAGWAITFGSDLND